MNVSNTTVSVKDAVRAKNLTIRVKVKGARIYRWRIRLASLLFGFGAWLVYGNLELTLAESHSGMDTDGDTDLR